MLRLRVLWNTMTQPIDCWTTKDLSTWLATSFESVRTSKGRILKAFAFLRPINAASYSAVLLVVSNCSLATYRIGTPPGEVRIAVMHAPLWDHEPSECMTHGCSTGLGSRTDVGVHLATKSARTWDMIVVWATKCRSKGDSSATHLLRRPVISFPRSTSPKGYCEGTILGYCCLGTSALPCCRMFRHCLVVCEERPWKVQYRSFLILLQKGCCCPPTCWVLNSLWRACTSSTTITTLLARSVLNFFHVMGAWFGLGYGPWLAMGVGWTWTGAELTI